MGLETAKVLYRHFIDIGRTPAAENLRKRFLKSERVDLAELIKPKEKKKDGKKSKRRAKQ